MSRLQVALVPWLGAVPSTLVAQVELTMHGGVHVDRAPVASARSVFRHDLLFMPGLMYALR